MREVAPDVYLVMVPHVFGDDVTAYLEEVGGGAWGAKRGFDDPSLPAFPSVEELIEFGGRLCYRSWEPGLNANVRKVREDAGEYLRNILKSGHGSVLEHASLSFVFHNVSRVFTHELVRHRVGTAVSQESLRFVRLTDLPFWFPGWVQGDEELMRAARHLLRDMEQFQSWMAQHFGLDSEDVSFEEKKAKTSFMRRFAPEGVATGVLWTANVRAIRHVVEMRTALGAEEEIRLVFDKVAALVRAAYPLLFGDYVRADDGTWETEFRKV